MGKTHEWSSTEGGKALGLRADPNNPFQDIINIINIPKSIVPAINQHGTGISKPHPGCPKKLSSCDVCQIIRYIRTNKSTCRITLTCLKKLFLFRSEEHTSELQSPM